MNMSSMFIFFMLTAVYAELQVRKLPPSSCKSFKQPGMWMRHTRLFELPKTLNVSDDHEDVENRQYFTLACRPVVDVENYLGIPWHVVFTRMDKADGKEVRGVLRRALLRLGFRFTNVDGEVVPSKWAKTEHGLFDAFNERLPDSFYISVLPHPTEHCLAPLGEASASDKIETLKLCRNAVHRATRLSKEHDAMDLVRSYDLPIPADRLEEGLLVLKHKLQLEIQDVLFVRQSHPTSAISSEEQEALEATGIAVADRADDCEARYAAGECESNKVYMEEHCARTCREKAAQQEDAAAKEELKKNLRSTTEAPESEDEELLDEEELALKREKQERDKKRKEAADEENLQAALQDFVMDNTIDYNVMNYASAKLNKEIEGYGPGFNDDLTAFRQMLHSVHAQCSGLGEVEEDACIRRTADKQHGSDL
jgi:hypothetical protein